MGKRKKRQQKEKMRKEREVMIFRRGKQKKRLRGGKNEKQVDEREQKRIWNAKN